MIAGTCLVDATSVDDITLTSGGETLIERTRARGPDGSAQGLGIGRRARDTLFSDPMTGVGPVTAFVIAASWPDTDVPTGLRGAAIEVRDRSRGPDAGGGVSCNDPFPADWTRIVSGLRGGDARPGADRHPRWWRRPVTMPRVAFDGMAPLRVQWSPVALASYYEVTISRVYLDQNRTAVESTAMVTTGDSWIDVPAEAFTGGEQWTVEVAAVRDEGGFDEGRLLDRGLPYARSSAATPIFRLSTTCGDGVREGTSPAIPAPRPLRSVTSIAPSRPAAMAC